MQSTLHFPSLKLHQKYLFTLIGVMCVMVTGSMVMVTCLRGPMLEEDASDGES